MEAALKGLVSSDIPDIEKYWPAQEDNFGFALRALVGPMGQPGEESFDITVCTPKWLAEQYGASETVLGLHKLIVFSYDYLRLRRFIEKYLMRCSGNSWTEIAQKVALLGQWEFENYRAPAPFVSTPGKSFISGQSFESHREKLQVSSALSFSWIFSSAGGVLFPAQILARSTPEGQSRCAIDSFFLFCIPPHQIEAEWP